MRKMPRALAHIYNTIVVVVGFGIFYFTDLGKLGTFLGNLVGMNGNSFVDQISTQNMMANAWLVIVSIVLCMYESLPCNLGRSDGAQCGSVCAEQYTACKRYQQPVYLLAVLRKE